MISTSPLPSISLIEAFRKGTKLAHVKGLREESTAGTGSDFFSPAELVVRVSG